ncbi:GNAT family N-acetyltransferase [Nocardia sp. NPDC002869]|uniref:GNAT family N-acetyltransferase n=1 Tax=Nocardia sp. NPDC002869 TaxID=3161032 RepID=UPI00398CD7B8
MAIPHGSAYIDTTGHGVIAFLPPDTPAPTAEVSARIAELHGDRLDRLMAAEERISTLPVPDGAWLLATIGTTSQSRGTGLGTALMKHGLTELDGAGHACWLDTSTERNLPLYQRFGFAMVEHITLDGGVSVWRMHRREPWCADSEGLGDLLDGLLLVQRGPCRGELAGLSLRGRPGCLPWAAATSRA